MLHKIKTAKTFFFAAILAAVIGTALVVVLGSCKQDHGGTVTVSVTEVKLDKTTLGLVKDTTGKLNATVLPANAANKNVTWASDKPNIASIAQDGTVTAKSQGSTVITVTTQDGGKTAKCTVTVTETAVAVTGVTLNETAITIIEGSNSKLIASIEPANATNTNVTWTSDKPNIASIAQDGTVTAKSQGSAVITVTTQDGGKTASCTVTVTEAAVAVTGVTLNETAITIIEGSNIKLIASIEPSNATNKNVTWSSNKAESAEVDQEGTVTAKAIGEAEITVTTQDGGKTAKCILQVTGGSDFVLITPPTEGISGIETSETLPAYAPHKWKGVFIKDRTVKLTPYSIGKYEVTYKLWKDVYDWALQKGYKFCNEGQKGSKGDESSELEPVTMITWRDAVIWCNAYTEKTMGEDQCIYRRSDSDHAVLKDVNEKVENKLICYYAYADMSKKGYRLPTEAEWEFAARWQENDNTNAEKYGALNLTKLISLSGAKKHAGTEVLSSPPTGETWESLRDEGLRVAVFKKYYTGKKGGWKDATTEENKTLEVGKKAANYLGLYDMSGNVSEMCFDVWDSSPKSGDNGNNEVTDPQGKKASGHFSTILRLVKGGTFENESKYCSVGWRLAMSMDTAAKSKAIGFRLVCRP